MSDVELKCAIYGEATVFSVKIARDAKVSALQEAIAGILSTQQHFIPPSIVTLYLAHKNGAWLKHDKKVESFLRGENDKQYKETRPSWKLAKNEVFGSEFELGEKRIHVLVEVSPQQHTRTTRKMALECGGSAIVDQPLCYKQRSCDKKTNSGVKDLDYDATWNEAVQRMEVGGINHPGIAIGWADDATLHACLGITGAPVAQGANAAASGVALRAWFSGLVVAVHANSPAMLAGGIPSSEFFDHLSIAEYGVLANALNSIPINLVWGPALNAAGVSAGRFFMVTHTGRGRNHAMHQVYVPFL
nr:crinkler 18 [Plasmopara viticola]